MLLRNDFKRPLNAKTIFNFESISYSVQKVKTYLMVLKLICEVYFDRCCLSNICFTTKGTKRFK